MTACGLAGCAGASVSQPTVEQPVATGRPSRIIVYPFAVNSAEVTLNQSIVQRAYRALSDKDQSAMQAKIADDTAQQICDEVSAGLTQKGYQAACQARGVRLDGANLLVVDGEFTDISEGNRLRRLVIGFGAGASVLDTNVNVFQTTDEGTRPIIEFTTHADSGKMPGAAVTGGAGAAAGGAAVVVAGTSAAIGGAKTYVSSTGYLAQKTADQIVQTIAQYYAQRGWSS